MSMPFVSVSAGDTVYGVATLMGTVGTNSSWEQNDESVSIDGNAQYEVTWTMDASDTGSSWFLMLVIEPEGDVENFTTDTLEDLTVTLDAVYVDGVELEDLSGAVVNTAYYEGGAGVTRIFLHDDWAGTKANCIESGTIEQSVTVVFTIAGLEEEGTSNVGTTNSGGTTSDDDDTTADPADDLAEATELGVATIMGSFGTNSNWDQTDESVVIDGDAQYEVTWTVEASETGSSWFVILVIEPSGDVENFTTDTIENLTVTLDAVYVDGVEIEDLSGAVVNTAYYEGGAGVTRIFLHDDWAGTKANCISDGTIEESITVVFTVSGTGYAGNSNIGGDVVLGDVNGDGKIDAGDASQVLVYAAEVGSGGDASGYTDDFLTAANFNGDDTIDASDASAILAYAAAEGVK